MTPDTRSTSKTARRVYVVLMLVSYLGLTYVPHLGSWVALTGAALVCVFARLAWPDEWRTRTGTRISSRAAIGTAALAVGCLLATSAWMTAERVGLGPVALARLESTQMLHTLGQTLNEELILGALLLTTCMAGLPRARLITISIAVAACFALLHLAFYGLRPESAYNHGMLTLPTVLALFFGGILRNNLILSSGHIGYSWALHFGLNTILFAGHHDTHGAMLEEPELFNALFGTWPNVAVLAVLAVASFIIGKERLLARGVSR